MDKKEKIKEILTRGVENVYPNPETLEQVFNSTRKLKIYCGIDPTGQLHIGHGVVMHKLRQLQDLGHEIVVLIGDFTAMVGDPTGKADARKQLNHKQVLANAKNYRKLIGKILDLKKTSFKYNSKWLAKMKLATVIELLSHFSAQRLLERDMFQERMKAGHEIFLHEFVYPALVGYDCVVLDVDMEVGGNDQTFNMLAGRTLMKKMKNKEKFVLTTKLLTDPSGKKMGKTSGNMVNLTDVPKEMYGKVMSWTDEMIVPALEIATTMPINNIEQVGQELKDGANPKKYKMLLAHKIVELYHGAKAAAAAEENFKQVFEEKLNPDDIKAVKTDKRNIVEVLVVTGLAESNSEARRLIAQGGVKVDGKLVKDETFMIADINADGVVIQKGKRHFVKLAN